MANRGTPQAAGEVAILNVGDGDTKLSFDPKNPVERIRAARIVRDMIRRGYALLVEVSPGTYQRALDFDENKCEYIIADFDPIAAAEHDKESKSDGIPQGGQGQGEAVEGESGAAQSKKRAGGGATRRTIKAESARSVAVARTSGG